MKAIKFAALALVFSASTLCAQGMQKDTMMKKASPAMGKHKKSKMKKDAMEMKMTKRRWTRMRRR